MGDDTRLLHSSAAQSSLPDAATLIKSNFYDSILYTHLHVFLTIFTLSCIYCCAYIKHKAATVWLDHCMDQEAECWLVEAGRGGRVMELGMHNSLGIWALLGKNPVRWKICHVYHKKEDCRNYIVWIKGVRTKLWSFKNLVTLF